MIHDPSKGLVEQCIKVVPDCFQLVVLSSYRAQELASGATPCVENEKASKDTLVALREVASNKLDLDALRERVICSFQHYAFLAQE